MSVFIFVFKDLPRHLAMNTFPWELLIEIKIQMSVDKSASI